MAPNEFGFRQWSADSVSADALLGETYTSQRECVAAIKRANPAQELSAPDEYGQVSAVTHYRDYVESFEAIPYAMNSVGYIA